MLGAVRVPLLALVVVPCWELVVTVLGVVVTVLGLVATVLGLVATVLGLVVTVLGLVVTVLGLVATVLGLVATVLGLVVTVLGLVVTVLGLVAVPAPGVVRDPPLPAAGAAGPAGCGDLGLVIARRGWVGQRLAGGSSAADESGDEHEHANDQWKPAPVRMCG